ncbi:hypothetical protein SteCoe_873 [Stentor coeruleus]|uniref:Uncharacterized protein n=1 Tax=Stentor coeruleus TaxID=5963 RepID=A0A1R2D308_9CILI|nr:hypothetical protein SteCoe_873 [Stentor coeruleus]
MSGSIVENFILKEDFGSKNFNAKNLINDEVAIGYFIGYIQTNDVDINQLKDVFREKNIDPISRGVVSIKIFSVLKEIIENFDDKVNLYWEFGKNVIDDFSRLSYDLINISNQLGDILELVSETYKSCFNAILRKFALNDSICTLGRAGLLLQKKFNIECTLFFLNEAELYILENWKTESSRKVLTIIDKGSQIIFERNLPQSDSLSITIYVILQAQFSNHNFDPEDFPMLEDIIIKYIKNFSFKQKRRLGSIYQNLCKKLSSPCNKEIIERLNSSEYNNSSQIMGGSNSGHNNSLNIGKSNYGNYSSQIIERPNTGYNNQPYRNSIYPSNKDRRIRDYADDYNGYNKSSEKYRNNYDRKMRVQKQYYYPDDPEHKKIDEEYYKFEYDNFDVFEGVRKYFDEIIKDVRITAKRNGFIDEDELARKINELADVSQESVFYLLEYYSRNETYNTPESLSTWMHLKNAVDICGLLNPVQNEAFMRNIEYIVENTLQNQ